MLQEITLKNFKIFEEVTIKPRLITVLIGPNGTGKSSIFQALGLMKQSRDNDRLKMDGPLVFGDFPDFLHKSIDAPQDPELALKVNISMTQPLGSFLSIKGSLMYEARFLNGLLSSQTARLVQDDELLLEVSYNRAEGKSLATPQWFPEKSPSAGQVTFNSSAGFARPFNIAAVRRTIETTFEDDARRFCEILVEAFDNMYIVPALRGFEQLTHKQLPDRIVKTDLLEWTTYQQRAEAVATILFHERQIEEKVSYWVAKVTERGVSRRPVENYHIAIESSSGQAKFNVVHEGFGTNQLFYLFTQVALAPAESLLCIDEPEIHLHPKAQNSLTSVLVDIATDTKEPKRLILSTHSEHILMALLTLVAEDRLRPEDLAVYYFQRTEDGDSATAERIEVNDKGQIRGGLGGFFGTDEEADRYIKALFSKV